MNRKNPLSSGKLLYCIILHFHWQRILESLIRKRYFLFSFKNNLFQLRVLYLTSFWILGMQPRNIGHVRGQWNNFFPKDLHKNGVQLPGESNAFVVDHQMMSVLE